MSLFNSEEAYSDFSKFLHWVIAVLVIGMLIYGFLLDSIPKGGRSSAVYAHKLLGMIILCLMLIRLGWVLINQKPILPLEVKWWESYAERLVHYSLYLTLIAMPLVGWIGSVAAGKPPYIGNTRFYLPIAQSKDVSHLMFKLHNQIAFIIIGLLIIHTAAAFFHHLIRKDNVLKRMLP